MTPPLACRGAAQAVVVANFIENTAFALDSKAKLAMNMCVAIDHFQRVTVSPLGQAR
jgi:hypothetical protein